MRTSQSISLGGRTLAILDPDYLALKSEYLALRNELVAKHGTLAAAARTNDEKYFKFGLAYNRQSYALQKAAEKIYR